MLRSPNSRPRRSAPASDSADAVALGERHPARITRWYYDGPAAIHAALGVMHAEGARFAASGNRYAPSLAAYVSGAIAAAHASRGS